MCFVRRLLLSLRTHVKQSNLMNLPYFLIGSPRFARDDKKGHYVPIDTSLELPTEQRSEQFDTQYDSNGTNLKTNNPRL